MSEQIMNTMGTAHRLGCSVTWVHKLVARNLLRAHMYNAEGELVPRHPGMRRQGQGLYFYVSDIEQFEKTRRGRGRPSGSSKHAPLLSTLA